MGVAAGGNINPDPGGVSMFEPMGGSAPKYTGTGKINPIAAINAVSMLLDQLGQPKAGQARDERHPESHRHQDEKPGRRQDGLHHEPSRRFGVRSDRLRLNDSHAPLARHSRGLSHALSRLAPRPSTQRIWASA